MNCCYINLQGYALSDDDTNPLKWIFPSTVLLPGEKRLIWASGKNRKGSFLHTNFKLSQSGEAVLLTAPNRALADRIQVPPLNPNHTHGRTTDGDDTWACFDVGTPNASNAQGHQLPACNTNAPTCNLAQGFYQQQIHIAWSCDYPNAVIHFTTDGSEPTEDAPIYTDTITSDTTIVLRARAFSLNAAPSPIVSRTFWVHEPLSSLPVISLVANPVLLFSDAQGIFELGYFANPDFPYYNANFWQEWEVPVSVSLLENNVNTEGFTGDFDMAVHGGSIARTRPQKAVRLMAKSKYGLPFLEYKLFPDRPMTRFKTFVLRNAGSDFNEGQCRDGLIHTICNRFNLKHEVNSYRPVTVYINGKYWGIQDLREKIDEDYVWSHEGYAAKDIDFLEKDTLVWSRDTRNFSELLDLAKQGDRNSDSWLKAMSNRIDLESFSDYFITETYFNNYDWPRNNIKYWKPRVPQERWQYIMFDLDVALSGESWCTPTDNLLGYLATPLFNENLHVQLFRALNENKTFNNYFVNRYADLINTAFSSDSTTKVLNEVIAALSPEMPRHTMRWGGSISHWESELNNEIRPFLQERPTFQRQFIRDAFGSGKEVTISINTQPLGISSIKLNTLTLNGNDWNGVYFSEVPVTMIAHIPTDYTLLGWTIDGIWQETSDSVWVHKFDRDAHVEAHFIKKDNFANPRLYVFPNPASDLLNVKSNFQTEGIFRLYNTLGQVVKTTKSQPESLLLLDISILPSGIYYYEYKTNNEIETGKVVIEQ